MNPAAKSPADAKGLCDCSGFTDWCFGLSRASKDPLHVMINGGWLNSDALEADARDPRGIFDRVVAGLARPGDLFVYGRKPGEKYGHAGIISEVQNGTPTRAIHCSPANDKGSGAIAETGVGVFRRHNALIARYIHIEEDDPPEPRPTLVVRGKMSTFGGPHDTGVAPEEGLAFIELAHLGDPRLSALFLDMQPAGTSGLARRLNPDRFYVACRWPYTHLTPTERQLWKKHLRASIARVINPGTGDFEYARPVDWGPHERTGRVADLSPGLAAALGVKTDDVVQVELPLPRR